MPTRGNGDHGRSIHERPPVSTAQGILIILFFITAVLGGCGRAPDLSAVYERIENKIQHGELDAAMADIERDGRRYAPKGADWDWSFRILKAHVHIYRREYQETLNLLRGPLPAELEKTEQGVRKSIYEGAAYRWAQQYEASEQSFERAELLAQRNHPKLLAEVLNSRAQVQSDEKRYGEAVGTLQRALEFARKYKSQEQELKALASLGVANLLRERFDEALEWNRVALELATKSGREDMAKLITGNIGASYFALGDFKNARPNFFEAAEDAGKRGLFSTQAHWLMALAECYFAEREYAEAKRTLERGLQIAEPLEEKTALTECLNDLAAVALETGDLGVAEKYNREELEIEGAGLDRSAVLDSQLIRGRIAAGKREYAEAEGLLQEIANSPSASLPLRWEAQARLAKTLDDEGKTADAERQYREAILKIESARKGRTLEELKFSFLTTSIDFYEDYVDFLVAHGRNEDALKVGELSRARTLVNGLAPGAEAGLGSMAALHPEKVAQRLRQTVLFYWIGRSKSYVWVIAPGKSSYFSLAKWGEIVPLVETYREALRSLRDANDSGGEAGKKLYTMLVGPASEALPKEGRIILVPDPSLSALNFETLIAPGAGAGSDSGVGPHFWIEDVTLTNASSLTLLAKGLGHATASGKANGRSLLLVGNTEPVEQFAALPKAKEEMEMVEQYFPEKSREVLEGKRATPGAYAQSNPGRFTYLHFVTHGTASVTRPLDSAVILSKSGDSYKLYAREIVQHPLTAQLVTISACEGANGRAYSGEGLVGLSWAFLRAGAHSVVGALWEVNDSAAPKIMDVFYREMSRGQDSAAALRAAKLSLLKNKDPEIVFRKPHYWAAFQLYSGS